MIFNSSFGSGRAEKDNRKSLAGVLFRSFSMVGSQVGEGNDCHRAEKRFFRNSVRLCHYMVVIVV
jgi:hypothetical protein